MLAWMDPEALDATIATGDVHFHSRSRGRLWRKGETSGHVLRLVDMSPTATPMRCWPPTRPARPATAARGRASTPRTRTTADDAGLRLAREAVGHDRRPRASRPAGSYTAR